MIIRSEPRVEDPREMHTILSFSLKDLWGDWEPHSCVLKIESARQDDEVLMNLRCLTDSVGAIRAALTLVSPPSYLSSNLYRFDVLEVIPEDS